MKNLPGLFLSILVFLGGCGGGSSEYGPVTVHLMTTERDQPGCAPVHLTASGKVLLSCVKAPTRDNPGYVWSISDGLKSVHDLYPETKGVSFADLVSITEKGVLVANVLSSSGSERAMLIYPDGRTASPLSLPSRFEAASDDGAYVIGTENDSLRILQGETPIALPYGFSIVSSTGGHIGDIARINKNGEFVGLKTELRDTTQVAVGFIGNLSGVRFIETEGDSLASDINDSGDVVGQFEAIRRTITLPGGAEGTEVLHHAFLYKKNGTLTDLTPKEEETGTSARAINNRGKIVGAFISTSDHFAQRAFVTDESHNLVALNELLPAESGWTLLDGWDINDSGQIVGLGIFQGVLSTYLLDLPPELAQ